MSGEGRTGVPRLRGTGNKWMSDVEPVIRNVVIKFTDSNLPVFLQLRPVGVIVPMTVEEAYIVWDDDGQPKVVVKIKDFSDRLLTPRAVI